MEYLQSLLDSSEIPVVTAFLLGLLTAVSPCPLATNITAIGFISKNLDSRNRIFLNGLLYTAGRMIAYSVLGAILIVFSDKLHLPKFGFSASERTERLKGAWGSLLLGILFAMAFCPTSGLFYFGMLIPMAAMEGEGYFLPVVYALATGLPVMLAAWVLAYSVSGIGKFYNKMQVFQKWFSRIVAVVFIFVGIYYGLMMYNLI